MLELKDYLMIWLICVLVIDICVMMLSYKEGYYADNIRKPILNKIKTKFSICKHL